MNAMHLYILQESVNDSAGRALAALAGFAGVAVKSIVDADVDRSPGEAIHVAATGRSLHAFVLRPESRTWLLRELAIPGSTLFLDGAAADVSAFDTIRSLVPDVVAGVRRVGPGDVEYRISAGTADGLDVFAGLSFGPVDQTSHTLDFTGTADVSPLISVNSGACYVKILRGGTSIFLNACEAPLDIESPASKTDDILDRFLSFAPFLAYLRTTFGHQCWHNPRPAACVIIDDPLLKPRYGFLNFAQLEAAIDRSSFSTTIAFIPWNCRRSHPAVARRFTRGDRRLSVCIHGCDHTGAEFGSIQPDVLRSRARRAMRSMDTHQQLTGIPHNRVMVFPQGVFSKASLKALEQEGFTAAVNTTVHPVDGGDEISFRDLMDVAVVRFDGVPLFMRHYPGRPARFALDLFLGRPVLVVEHHSFFRNGYDTLEWYASFINRIAPNIQWTDLDELCASAYRARMDSSGDVQIEGFGSVVRVANDGKEPMRASVVNRWARNDMESVSWNGCSIEFDRHTGARCHLELGAGQRGELRYQRARTEQSLRVVDPTAADRMRVFVRRRLCEFRDNHVATSSALRPLAKVIRPVFSRI
jgi:hypothetical protein